VISPTSAIRVATWNIRAAIGPGEPFPPAWWRHVDATRLERIGSIIRGLEADVVALQEVSVFTADGLLRDQPGRLGELTGLEVAYTATHAFALVRPEDGRVIGSAMWGNALLSRAPFDSIDAVGLPVGADDDLVEPAGSDRPLAGVRFGDAEPGVREPRSVIAARLPLGPASLSVVGTHLTYAGSGQRADQAAALADLALERGEPVLVVGDLNDAIEAPQLASLAGSFDDAFAAVGVPAGDPRRASCGALRIDHILSRGLRVVGCRVERSAGDASDHLPVIADLEVASGT